MTSSLRNRICYAMMKTWQSIGADCLVNERGEPDESVTLSREEVIELVTDADRLVTYGGDDEAAKAYYNLDDKDKDELSKLAFPFAQYGW